jgi:hypothetical protein
MSTSTAALKQTTQFWREFYAKHSLRHDPSPFAQWCLEKQLNPANRLLELGCGNGRDSFAFLHHGLPVIAVDGCEVAIEDNIAHYNACSLKAEGGFYALNFAELQKLTVVAGQQLEVVNTIYTRFVLHAIPETLEDELIAFAASILPKGGKMLHEFRTIRDPLMKQGEVLSSNERLTDHYRRFLDPDHLREKLANAGWKELFFIEAQGLATFGDDDPVVARIVVEKK